MNIEEAIEKKKAEILNYERILSEYGRGRWYDMGRRHLASLKEELAALEDETTPSCMELVDRLASEVSVERRVGSSPTEGTKLENENE